MIRGILLAAGAGTRFGADKLLHPVADGVPLAVAAARTLAAVLPGSLAVVRPGAPELARWLAAQGLEVVVNPRAGQGMGASLARGVAAAREADGWVIALADMPWVQADTVAAVAGALAAGAVLAAPLYRGRRGHPVGIGREFLDELLALRGDAGARALLRREAGRLRELATADPGAVWDVDRPRDLAPSRRPCQQL